MDHTQPRALSATTGRNRQADEMTTEDVAAEPAPRSDRVFKIGFLSLVGVATLGWLFAIARGVLALADWLLG